MAFDGERLRQLRMLASLSRRELAEKIGCHENELYKYEKAGTVPRAKRIEELALALGVDTKDFESGIDELPASVDIILNQVRDACLRAEIEKDKINYVTAYLQGWFAGGSCMSSRASAENDRAGRGKGCKHQ